MLDWLRYRRELSAIKEQNAKDIAPLHAAYFEAMHQNKLQSEKQELFEKLSDQVVVNGDRIALLETNYLLSQAEKRLVSIPDRSDAYILDRPELSIKWRRPKQAVDLILTDEGLRELRLALRADSRERLEILRSWIAAIIPGLTGLIGVLIGLLAVILGRR